MGLVLLAAIGGLWLISLNNPFDSRRWGPVLYPPTPVVTLFGVGITLLFLLLLLVFRVAQRTELGTRGQWLILSGTCVGFLTSLQLILAAEVRTMLAYRPHPLLEHERIPHNLLQKTNSLGLPGEEFPVEKPPGELRIVVIGDCAGVSLGDRLQTELARLYPGRRIRLINASLSGYSILTSVRNIRLRLQRLEPDLFIICHINDLEMVPVAEAEAYPMTPLMPLKIAMYQTELYLCLRKIVINSTPKKGLTEGKLVRRLSDEQLERCYSECLELSQAKGKRSLLISMPRNHQGTKDELAGYHQLLQRLCEQHGGVWVDAFHAVEGRSDLASLFVTDDHHPSPAGVEVILNLVLQALQDNHLLDSAAKD